MMKLQPRRWKAPHLLTPLLLLATPLMFAALALTLSGCTSAPPSSSSGNTTSNTSSGSTSSASDTGLVMVDTGASSDTEGPPVDSGEVAMDTAVPPEDTGAPPMDTATPDVVDIRPSVRVATFNVQRFFDTQCDSNQCGGNSFEEVFSSAEFEEKADRVASAIRQMEADIVLLQEIETTDCLNALTSRLQDIYPSAVLGETGANASLDVAILGGGGVVLTRSHRDQEIARPDGGSTRFAREFLEVHLNFDGRRAIVFSAHFKSKNNDDPSRRLAEAIAARNIVISAATEFPGALVVMGGDLNDTPGSEPLNALEEGDLLARVAEELGTQDWTYRFQGGTEALDHLYVAQPAAGEHVPSSTQVFRDGRGRWGGSDHAALGADFAWPE